MPKSLEPITVESCITTFEAVRAVISDAANEITLPNNRINHAKAHELARRAGEASLGRRGAYPAEVLYDIMPQIDRETALIEYDLLDSSKPIRIAVGELFGFATALEVAAKAKGHTYVGSFNDTLLILTPETTAHDAVAILEQERYS